MLNFPLSRGSATGWFARDPDEQSRSCFFRATKYYIIERSTSPTGCSPNSLPSVVRFKCTKQVKANKLLIPRRLDRKEKKYNLLDADAVAFNVICVFSTSRTIPT